MRFIFNLLASAAGIYSVIIMIRIIISWFSGTGYSRPAAFLNRITDPYLDFWRKNFNLRLGILDVSPILGFAFLSVLRSIFITIAHTARISAGNIIAILLMAVWSVVSFILGFSIIVLVLFMIACLTNRDMYTPFWKLVESVSQPIIYRINKIIFGNKINNYKTSLIVPVLVLTALWLIGRIFIPIAAMLISALPL